MSDVSITNSEVSVIDRLAAHRTLQSVPREQLEWLAARGHVRTLEVGDLLTAGGATVGGVHVVLSGHLTLHVDRGAGPRLVIEWRGGDITGVLPYSRIRAAPGDVVAQERTEVFSLDTSEIRSMISANYELTAVMVHVMLDRARVFNSNELLDEKLVSLGKLAAGLAHELNNPASAVARSAKTLTAEIEKLDNTARQLGQMNMSDTQYFSIASLRDQDADTPLTPLELGDREDAIDTWLEDHGVTNVATEHLAASSFGPEDLDTLNAKVGAEKIGAVLSHIASEQNVRRLAREISSAAERIHALVDAVKGFTYMDQQIALKPVAIERGLRDTFTMHGAKARAKNVKLTLDVAADLPMVDGYGGELNQVWNNLVDNAIDAAPNGNVKASACVEMGKVVVRVIDDGHGIPPDVLARIFDPFFTTKPVGEGTGLGLDIARRLVQRHHGVLDVFSGEKGTEFRVTLPLSAGLSSTPQTAP